MKQKAFGIRPLDIIIFCVLLAITIFTSTLVYGKKNTKTMLRITSPKGQWLYPLDENREISVPGSIGDTKIVIDGGVASIVESPCPNQSCLSGTKIKSTGDWNACLPNRVMLSGEGDLSNSEIDIISQ